MLFRSREELEQTREALAERKIIERAKGLLMQRRRLNEQDAYSTLRRQAMNTGHDGSMGTLHANSPREALSRVESMITMGGFTLPAKTIREMIVGSIDVVVQASRLRDGSRRIMCVTEVMGLEGDTIVLQDILKYEITGEDENGKIIGAHKGTGIGRPRFWERAQYYNLEHDLAKALDELD